jgi:hypothetical protein
MKRSHEIDIALTGRGGGALFAGLARAQLPGPQG